jgi:glycosyltransferase involved in cell wall biosynthesis
MLNIAIVRGPWFRPNSTLLWEYIHNAYDDISVTGFNSDPAWFDPSELDLPIEDLDWWDGKIDSFGHENVIYQILEKYGFPNIALSGIKRVVEEYDIVHITENYRLYSLYAALLCDRRETTLFVDCHENIPHRPANPVALAVKRTVNHLADEFTCPTMDSKRALIHEGVDPDDIHILPNVVDLNLFDEGPKDADRASLPEHLESTFNILFVHGLNKRKGTKFLIGAFEQIREQFDDVSLILVGDNDLNNKYYNDHVAANPDVYHVEYIPEIRDLYNLSDVFVLPSIAVKKWEEQFGRVLVESMACGLPSVVTDVGGPRFVVEEGKTSFVVSARSSESLAEALTELYEDEQCRQEMGQRAYEYVRETYAPDTVGDKLYNMYRSA